MVRQQARRLYMSCVDWGVTTLEIDLEIDDGVRPSILELPTVQSPLAQCQLVPSLSGREQQYLKERRSNRPREQRSRRGGVR